jgi:hypothetical protein
MPVFAVVERPAQPTCLHPGEVPACPKGHGRLYQAAGAWHCWECEEPAPDEEVIPVALCVTEAIESSLQATVEEQARPAPAEEMLSVKQAAQLLGLSEGAVHWQIRRKYLPVTLKGKRIFLIPRSAVEARLAEMQSPEYRRHPKRSAEKVRTLDAQALGVAAPKQPPAPALRDLLKRHNDATVLYMTLHTGWQTAVREEAELRQQVLAAEGAMYEAVLMLNEGLAKLKGPAEGNGAVRA